MARVETGAIERELDRIRLLDLEKLRSEWRRLYRSEPPKISRDLFVLALGYRLQEIEYGGLGKSTRRKLQTVAKALRKTGRVGPLPSLSLKPGARLLREFAKKITGAHWSGPRFFGLPNPGAQRATKEARGD
jgi:Protein of unknown function (DUF2924)